MSLIETASLTAFAFTAGVFTFFAPCAYPLLPGYVSYYLGQTTAEERHRSGVGQSLPTGRVTAAFARVLGWVVPAPVAPRLARATVISLLVSAGFFVVFGVLAGVVVSLGARVLAGISVLELVVGVVLIVIGGLMATDHKLPTPSIALPKRRRSRANYVGFGLLYGTAAAGCTAPIFIGVAVKAMAAGATVSLLVFGAYAAGMSSLMIGVTVASALGRDTLLRWTSDRLDHMYRGAGVLLVAAGIVQLYFFLFRFEGLALLGL